jgi:hypothetical protein
MNPSGAGITNGTEGDLASPIWETTEKVLKQLTELRVETKISNIGFNRYQANDF